MPTGDRAVRAQPSVEPKYRIALLEANRFHEEVIFAFVAAAALLPHGADVTVFAPNHWQATEYMQGDLRLGYSWQPFDVFRDLAAARLDFDLIIANTFPSPLGQDAIAAALDQGRVVFGLVHDIDFFESGAEAALRRWPTLILGHAGVVPPHAATVLDASLRKRIVRFIPVIHIPDGVNSAATRSGIALPGALEFARRDIVTALRLAAESGIRLRIFGRSKDQGDGPKRLRDLDGDRDRLHAAVDRLGAASVVDVSSDVSCSDFYHAVERSRFVAVMPNDPSYLRGKLTGAVTAALSCCVPMLALPDVHQHYTTSDPATFARCMLRFDPEASSGDGAAWSTFVRDMLLDDYLALCQATTAARERLLAENTATLGELLVSSRGGA
jgi:hypothetical protein